MSAPGSLIGLMYYVCGSRRKTRFFKLQKKEEKRKEREGDSDTYGDSMWLLKLSPKVAVPTQKAIRNLDWTVDAVVPLIIKAFKTCRYWS
jgi:hypothetical protein